MLDRETRHRIDSARDILVGKVPDPKSQVEQITIALIYKFMNDMDHETREQGGSRIFFAGKFEKYRWAKLMSPGMGGSEMLNLYAEAIEKMNENPGIPQLFRDIFKNAYLPYRDPETLRLFLKVIDEFRYTDSETLGDAFEYLLSVLGSQGKAGQFRTPRHIIDFIVDIVAPKKHEVILDPACGTGGFLISSYNYIRKANAKDGKPGATLKPRERKRLAENISGYDISPDYVSLALANMYLHGFREPRIYEYDTLTSEDRWNETADVILANPPFMTPKGGIRPHNRFSVQATKSEVLFVDYIAEHLSSKGRAGVIVPEGIIYRSKEKAYKQLRKMLVENYVVAVVSLPAGVFNPYTPVKTSILFMDKSLARKAGDILFVKVENDGYDLGKQRRPIEANDLPEAMLQVMAYFDTVRSNTLRNMEITADALVVSKGKINESANWNLNGELYREVEGIRKSGWSVVKLADICEFNPKKSEIREISKDTLVSFVPMSDLNENQISFIPKKEKALGDVYTGYTYFANGDVLLARVTPCFENGKSGIARNLKNGLGFGSSEYFVYRPNLSLVLAEWVYYQVSRKEFLEEGRQFMTGTGGLQRVSKEWAINYEIPLPPLSTQREIITEINGYQEIIGGARKVVESYTPRISIDSDWPVVKLGDVCRIVNGTTPSTAVSDYWDGDIVWVTPADLGKLEGMNIYSSGRKITKKSLKAARLKLLPVGAVVLSSRAPIGHLGIAKTPLCTNQGCKGFIPSEELNSEFLYFILQSHVSDFRRLGSGSTFKEISKSKLERFQISIPPIQVQEEIVAEIAKEAELVDANKALIALFEKKIKAKIAAVWGE